MDAANLLNHISEGFLFIDFDGNVTYANASALRMLDAASGMVQRTSLWSILSPAVKDIFQANVNEAWNKRANVRFKLKVDKPSWLEVSLYPCDTGMSVLLRDMTSHKNVMDAIEENNAKLMVLADTAQDLIFQEQPNQLLDRLFERLSAHLNLDVYFHYMVDPEACKLHLMNCHGIPEDDIRDIEWLEYGEGICGTVARDEQAFMAENILESSGIELKWVREHGIQAYVCYPLMSYGRVFGTLSFGSKTRAKFTAEELKLIRVICKRVAVTLDRLSLISELKRRNQRLQMKNEQLATLEERFSRVFHSIPHAMVITQASDGRVIDANETFVSWVGLARETVVDRPITEVVTMVTETGETLGAEGHARNVRDEKLIAITPSGKRRTVLYSCAALEVQGAPCFLGMYRELTEDDVLLKEMLRFETLNVIGEMAAGIGHEVRNPLTTVRGMLQLLGQNKTLRDESHYALMISEIDRANAIITKFLSLAKNTRVNLQQNDITKIVEYLFPLMQADAMVSGKRIVADIRPVPLLWLDQGQVRQLILNLVRNALEAMDEGGRVIIRTYTHAGYVVLAVQDEGPGIDKGVLAKLGTPFVTTKESGTGLGLAVCYSIAQRHKATIKVETGPRGTTFYVRFRPGERDPEE